MAVSALFELASQVGDALLSRAQLVVTAESCTGGWIAKIITDVPGSSRWFERGFVTYSNAAKQELLGVREATLQVYGAVSGETVTEMALGALCHSQAHLAVAVSGVAGPAGGHSEKPVGTVWLGWAIRDEGAFSHCYTFGGNREAVRQQSVIAALQGILDVCKAR
jgi:nicotinamide-nucleotide amidase